MGRSKGGDSYVPMEAVQVPALPAGGDWQYEPKWDGFRCIAVRGRSGVRLISKSGKDLGRYFPEIVDLIGAVRRAPFVVDGELCIPVGSVLSFDALQNRLHPAASRVKKLAAETPAVFILFDVLGLDGEDLRDEPLVKRRAALEKFYRGLRDPGGLRLSPATRTVTEARRWLKVAGAGALDGVVAKKLADSYRSGERAMLKVKCLRTADCVVGGFRYGTNSKKVGSLLLGLYNDNGRLDHVGFCSGIADAEKSALTKKLEAVKGGKGFTGDAPGAPSRWSTERSAEWVPLRNKYVVEVQYDHVTGNRFRHGTRLLRWRPDKSPQQCTLDQLQREARPSKLMASIRLLWSAGQ